MRDGLTLDLGCARTDGKRAARCGEPMSSNPYKGIGQPKLAAAWTLSWKSEAACNGMVPPPVPPY